MDTARHRLAFCPVPGCSGVPVGNCDWCPDHQRIVNDMRVWLHPHRHGYGFDIDRAELERDPSALGEPVAFDGCGTAAAISTDARVFEGCWPGVATIGAVMWDNICTPREGTHIRG
jgi:hypothetical protein